MLWGFISRYAPDATPQNSPMLDRLAAFAVRYYHDFVKPTKSYRTPNDKERAALTQLKAELDAGAPATPEQEGQSEPERYQNLCFRIGRESGFEPMKEWFSCLYEVLLGQSQGPRMGSFIALYGVKETATLIGRALEGRAEAA